MDNTNNWRDASTKPEKEADYLIHLVNKQIVIGLYKDNCWNYLDTEDRFWYDCSDSITHWMPLPKPPGE